MLQSRDANRSHKSSKIILAIVAEFYRTTYGEHKILDISMIFVCYKSLAFDSILTTNQNISDWIFMRIL